MDFIEKISEWFSSTHIDEQIKSADIVGLFTNPWFIVPFGAIVGYLLYKKRFVDLVIIAICVGLLWFSGTDYAHSLIVNGEIDLSKVLPVAFGGAGVVGLLMYLLFGRSD
ncbi:MAG: hypothetical protein CSA20_02320 [Deltaproteobacteria bacterium]|nr:MAG: hypothetical protein CSB23_02125 [Deltaproteobacteria bacterium]PIE73614.1 MAG: hypothetical protein CSA20_02320 [Deltaproteobacteria bacterium]